MKKHDVFFSYNWRDRAAVEAIASTLREQGLTVFLDRWYLVPGRPWLQALEEALNNCQAVSVFLGPHGMGGWQQREKDLALNRQARDSAFSVVPVLLPGADPALGFLSLNTWVDMQAGIDNPVAIDMLAAAARGQAPGPEVQEQMNATLASICPYRGLRAFREEDAPLFFGRETFTERLVEAVAGNTMIAVVGASGTGKSSVVRAGLVPHVRRGISGGVWDVATLVPGDRPLHALAAAVIPILEPEMGEIDRLAEIGKLAGYFTEKSVALRDIVARMLEKQPGTDHLLLVVDQWEELYTHGGGDQVQDLFIDELLEATIQGNLTVVLTLRGDFFGRALSHRALADRLQNAVVNLGPMIREELKRGIEAPAEKVHLTFERGLAGRILDDVEEGPGTLPLLEFVLAGLWERRRGGTLLHEAYEDMGEVRGAMARRADEVLAKLSPSEQKVVRQVLVRLVRPGEGTEDTKRRATLSEVGEAAKPVVQQLADARLTVTGRDEATNEQTVEIAHEALIHKWERLRGWMDEDREFLIWRERLRAHLDEWEDAGHDADALLRGVQLAEAEGQHAERMHELSDIECRFIEESLGLQERQRRAQQRRITITRVVAVVMAVLAISASLAGWYAYGQKKEAEAQTRRANDQTKIANNQKEIALAQKLVAQAELMMSRSPSLQQRGVLLAVESMHRLPSLEADQVLRHGLALLARPVAAVEQDGKVRCVVFSPDGSRMATASDPNTVRISNVPSGEKVAEVGHDMSVVSVAFSPDGKRLATGSIDCIVRILDANSGREMFRRNHDDTVSDIAFSPHGEYLATASRDCSAVIWNANSGEEIARIPHDSPVTRIAFDPNGQHVATASVDRTAKVWNVTSKKEMACLFHKSVVKDAEFTPDGEYLVTASADGIVCLWDWRTEKLVDRIRHEGAVTCVAFDSKGRRLATACQPGIARVWLWNGITYEEISWMKHEAGVLSLVFSENGKYLATASDCNAAQLWDATSGKEIAIMNHEAEVLSVALNPDDRYIGTAGADNVVRIWRASAGDWAIPVDHNGPVWAVAFEPDEQCFAAAGGEKTIQVSEIIRGERLDLKHDKISGHFLAFSPDGKYAATARDANTAQVWEIVSGDVITTIDASVPRLLHGRGRFSRTGKYLATPSDSRTVQVWDVAHGEKILEVNHDESVPVEFSDDGRYLATVGDDYVVRVRNVTSSDRVFEMPHKNSVYALAFSPDGKHVATGCDDNNARLWDWNNEKEVDRVLYEGDVSHVVFSPGDGKYLATVGNDSIVRVWDVTKREQVAEMSHTDKVSSVVFGPKGKVLAAGGDDGTVLLWNAETGDRLTRIGHEGTIRHIVFSSDGKYMATVSSEGTARIWVWRPDDLMDLAGRRLTRNLTYQEWQQYLPGEPYRKTFPDLP